MLIFISERRFFLDVMASKKKNNYLDFYFGLAEQFAPELKNFFDEVGEASQILKEIPDEQFEKITQGICGADFSPFGHPFCF